MLLGYQVSSSLAHENQSKSSDALNAQTDLRPIHQSVGRQLPVSQNVMVTVRENPCDRLKSLTAECVSM